MGRPGQFNRDAALKRARRIVWPQGCANASVGSLEEALGISRSSLSAAFGCAAFGSLEALIARAAARCAVAAPSAVSRTDSPDDVLPRIAATARDVRRVRAADAKARPPSRRRVDAASPARRCEPPATAGERGHAPATRRLPIGLGLLGPASRGGTRLRLGVDMTPLSHGLTPPRSGSAGAPPACAEAECGAADA
jgi:hypothetical protein